MKAEEILGILTKHDRKHKTDSAIQFMALVRASKQFGDMFCTIDNGKGARLKKYKSTYTPREFINAAGNLIDILVEMKAWDEILPK